MLLSRSRERLVRPWAVLALPLMRSAVRFVKVRHDGAGNPALDKTKDPVHRVLRMLQEVRTKLTR